MTQSITVQVGQCGNQIGCRFWDLALREHSSVNKDGTFDEPLSSFFRNVDTRQNPPLEIPLGDGRTPIAGLRARAVLVDMEEGVVNEITKGPLGEVFDSRQLITSVSGSGNNWAVGYQRYGIEYREKISESIRHAAEQCDCLQSFSVLHSMGGGTGSGLGTYILELLASEYPDVYRFVTCVYPSEDDDVITSPYNSVLAMHQLTEFADCVLPVENQSLLDICAKINKSQHKSAVKAKTAVTEAAGQEKQKPWDKMNNIVANMLLHLTSSARFEGSLNVDVNEITMNLFRTCCSDWLTLGQVPFPRMHYIVPSLTPLYSLADVNFPPRRLDQMFRDAFESDYQLIRADPRHGIYLACALLVRGNVEISDVRRNIEKMKSQVKFAPWNREGWKTGLCSVPPAGQPHALLCLANNTCVTSTFETLKKRFLKLYRKKAYRHHFISEGMDEDRFDTSLESLNSTIALYSELQANASRQEPAPRMTIV